MDIEYVLDRLGGFITMVFDRGAISNRELEEIEEVETLLWRYVREKEDA